MLYTVGEMAKLLGVAPSTLRYYDQEGLLPFVERSRGGMRLFTDADYEALLVIDCLKRSGLSIKEIKSYIALAREGDATLAERGALFERRREAVLAQLAALRETLALLDYKCWYYETARSHGGEAAARELPEEALPERFRAVRQKLRPMGKGERGAE